METFERSDLAARMGRMEQMASIARYVLDDGKGRGMRAFEVANGSPFQFTVYPDRGLDVGPARWCGKPLTWTTRNGPVHPAFYDASGAEWLRSWAGGLVTTCGWNNVGGPCETEYGAEGLHGRFDNLPAEEVNTRTGWREDGVYALEVSGKIRHGRVFGENLETVRTISTRLGWAGVELVDRTTNLGAATTPLMQLYHMNFGWPLVSETMRLVAPDHPVAARDAEAEKGLYEWATMPPPVAGFAEQVFYHDLPADADGTCSIRIANPAFFDPAGRLAAAGVATPALKLSFRKAELPFLVQWRQAGAGDYVMGLEPANCHPTGRVDFDKTGLLRRIEPGETVETRITVEIV